MASRILILAIVIITTVSCKNRSQLTKAYLYINIINYDSSMAIEKQFPDTITIYSIDDLTIIQRKRIKLYPVEQNERIEDSPYYDNFIDYSVFKKNNKEGWQLTSSPSSELKKVNVDSVQSTIFNIQIHRLADFWELTDSSEFYRRYRNKIKLNSQDTIEIKLDPKFLNFNYIVSTSLNNEFKNYVSEFKLIASPNLKTKEVISFRIVKLPPSNFDQELTKSLLKKIGTNPDTQL